MARRKGNETRALNTGIHFFSEEHAFRLKGKRILAEVLKTVISAEGMECAVVNIIFCKDEYLLKLNKQYLKHNTLTDIITFDYCENRRISGDIFISLDRVKENARKYAVSFLNELYRVMIHGVLHLLGYKDKSTTQKRIMRSKENQYLPLLLRPYKR